MQSFFRSLLPALLLAWVAATFLTVNISFAQTGPGGVGDLTGTSTLEVWLDANDLDGDGNTTNNPANGTAVSVWMDKSGNDNHLRQTTAARQPLYYVSAGEYNAVRFINDGGTTYDFMTFDDAAHLPEGTAFFVLVPVDAGSASNSLLDDNVRSMRIEQFEDDNDIGYTRYGIADYETNLSTSYNNLSIVSFRKDDSNATIRIRQNSNIANVIVGSNGDAGIPMTNMGRSGGNNNADAGSYRCIEIIVYSHYLNDAELRIMENHLSAKYGGVSIFAEDYAMDNPGNGDFDYEVVGIGQINSVNQVVAQSSFVRMHSPSSLHNGDLLYWGHDNGALDPVTSNLPAGVQARIERIWGIDETGNIGNVDVVFDLSGFGAVTASDLRLIIDTDNDGSFTDGGASEVSGAVSIGGGEYQFDNVSFPSMGRFTLGTINATQTPLPVELTSFDITHEPPIVVATWKTASELNNDYFTLERAGEDMKFDVIAQQPGAGTTSVVHTYTAIDPHPFGGRSYYRLKQTDYDGTSTYSQVRSVKIDETDRELVLFPNPNDGTNFVFTMGNAIFQLDEVEVINSHGVTMRRQKINRANVTEYPVDLGEKLPAGFYLVRASYNGRQKTFRVVVW